MANEADMDVTDAKQIRDHAMKKLINATVHMNGMRLWINQGWVAWQHSGDLLSTENACNISGLGLVTKRGFDDEMTGDNEGSHIQSEFVTYS